LPLRECPISQDARRSRHFWLLARRRRGPMLVGPCLLAAAQPRDKKSNQFQKKALRRRRGYSSTEDCRCVERVADSHSIDTPQCSRLAARHSGRKRRIFLIFGYSLNSFRVDLPFGFLSFLQLPAITDKGGRPLRKATLPEKASVLLAEAVKPTCLARCRNALQIWLSPKLLNFSKLQNFASK